jgi:SAM-dependent methyltransferase
MTTANAAQHDSWNGDNGLRWVARADERDRVLAPVADALLSAAAPTRGEHVLDIGCGCGATTLAAAHLVGSTGSATGIDLSQPMLEVAHTRTTDAAACGYISFVAGDAQTHPFRLASADLIISRFGTMFFADPRAAFTNMATALRPGGRICLATWRPLLDNQWLVVPGAALLGHTDLPAGEPDEAGMFAQSDPDRVTATLTASGLADIRFEPTTVTFDLGNLDSAVDYLADSGPGRRLLETLPEGPARQAALADVRDALADYEHGGTVRLDGAIWLITATKPHHHEAVTRG